MNGGVSAPFIRHPVATTLIMVAILLMGVVAYPLLSVAPLPQIDFPTISVSAKLPGASPETMASSVAQPLERQIAQIPGVSQMTSTSQLGATAISVQFDLDRNIDAAANDIQAAINAASGNLPKDLPGPPTYRKVNPSDTPILIMSVSSDTKTSSPSRSARFAAFRRCVSAASRRRRSASRSTRRSLSRRICSLRTCARRSASPPSTVRRAP
jgi:multidrug efflux pump subunit AcrB